MLMVNTPGRVRNAECGVRNSRAKPPEGRMKNAATQTLGVSEEESNVRDSCRVVVWRVPVLAEAKTVLSVVRQKPVMQHGSFGRR